MTKINKMNFDSDPPRTLREIEKWAEELAIPGAFDWVNSAAGAGYTSEINRDYFLKTAICPRVLRDVSKINIACKFLGHDLDLPMIIAPLGHLTQFHDDGEGELARGTESEGSIFCVSTQTRIALSEIRDMAKNARLIWQIYFYGDKSWVLEQINEARNQGCIAIAVCVDAPIRPVRYLDRESRYDGREHGRRTSAPGPDQPMNAKTTWEHIKWLKKEVKDMPILIKGIMSKEDARICQDIGIDAIWISNHGGRQLESGLSTLEVLEEIRSEVGDSVSIILDGGIRNGTDIVKAIALGADIVAIGRLAIYGLIAGGANGVHKIFELMREELIATMAMSGINDIKKIDKSYIRKKW